MDNIEILSNLIGINSIYPNENDIANYIKDILKDKIEVNEDLYNGRVNLFGSRGNAKVLFYAHLDTVDSTKDNWHTNPLKAEVVDNRVIGLGASDDKSGLANIISLIINTDLPLKFLFCSDEENISEGVWHFINNKKDFFEGVKLIISAEPSFGFNVSDVTNKRSGRVVFNITFQGDKKHIMYYKEAKDAIESFSEFSYKLYNNRSNFINSVIHISKVYGESIGMSICGLVDCDVEALINTPDTIESIRNKIQQFTNEPVKIKERKTPYLEPYSFDNIENKDTILNIVKEVTGEDAHFISRTSVADDNVLALTRIPVLTIGAKGGNEHKADEFVYIDKLNQAYNIYKRLLSLYK